MYLLQEPFRETQSERLVYLLHQKAAVMKGKLSHEGITHCKNVYCLVSLLLFLSCIFVIMIFMFWDLLRLRVSTLMSEPFKTWSGSCVAGEQQLLIISESF